MLRQLRSIALPERGATMIECITEQINRVVKPDAKTGELIINFSENGIWYKLYNGTLNDGAGKSCAADKVNTLINHPEYNWGGIIPENELSENEKKWYGSIRLKDCHDTERRYWVGNDIIIAFSDRKEWQDVLYVAAVIHVLKDALKIDFDLPEGIENDPYWGTALSICEKIF